MGNPKRSVPKGCTEGFCVYCPFIVSARGTEHALAALTDHAWYCAMVRAQNAFLAAAQSPQETV